MKGVDILLWIFSRAEASVSIEERHAEVMENMEKLGPPLGFAGLDLPPAPDCGEYLSADYGVRHQTRGLRFTGHYIYRENGYISEDSAKFDDQLRFGFKTSNKAVDYRAVLNEHLPEVIVAFRGYRTVVSYGPYSLAYEVGSADGTFVHDEKGYIIETNAVYNRLHEDKSINTDRRFFIYTLEPAQYWDATLCQRALGYGPDEVIRRLKGKVPKAERLMDGVYLVLNDDPALTYQDFLATNETIKPILGLL